LISVSDNFCYYTCFMLRSKSFLNRTPCVQMWGRTGRQHHGVSEFSYFLRTRYMQNRRHRGVVFLFFLTFGHRVSYSEMIYFSTWSMCSNRNCPKRRSNLHALLNGRPRSYLHIYLGKLVCIIRDFKHYLSLWNML
jgi:hypothetical protein